MFLDIDALFEVRGRTVLITGGATGLGTCAYISLSSLHTDWPRLVHGQGVRQEWCRGSYWGT